MKKNIKTFHHILKSCMGVFIKRKDKYTMVLGKIFLTSSLIIFCSCEEFLEVGSPTTEISNEDVFSSDESAERAIIGLYTEVYSGPAGGASSSISYLSSFSSDELHYLQTNNLYWIEFNTNSLSTDNRDVYSIWQKFYQYIFYANAALKGLNNSSGVSEALKAQLTGEAKCIRAFSYFYLVNLYGDVPLILSTDPQENRIASRMPKDEVYEQIILDLEEAIDLLPEDYSHANQEKIRVNKYVASALLARTHLYLQNWDKAESLASTVINNDLVYGIEPDLNDVFLGNSKETIWQLKPDIQNAFEGLTFIIIPGSTTLLRQELSGEVLEAFESEDDKRLLNWVSSSDVDGTEYYYPFKYKIHNNVDRDVPITEYSMVLRLAEQYLIRAEARAQQGNVTGAQADLNVIRNRAGLENTTANDQASLLAAIEQERFVELFTEWGHRWLDLKRTGRIDAVLGTLKTDWQPADALYPIPQSEVDVNANLTQNPGY